MKKTILILISALAVVISGCSNLEPKGCTEEAKLCSDGSVVVRNMDNNCEFDPCPETECSTDFDCDTGGCSGQICAEKEIAQEIITTCEFKEEYSCLEKTSCGCFEGKCQFEQNNDYLGCLDNFR